MELKHYLQVIRKRLLLISAIVIVVCVLVGIKSYMFTEQMYSASAKLIVSQTITTDGTQRMDLNSIQTNIMLINSYVEIINSSAILDKVVAQYPDLKTSPEEISSMLKVNPGNNSQVMTLTTTSHSYQRAANTVNAVANVFKNEIPSIMKVNNVTILTQADPKLNAGSINSSPIISIILSFIVSLMLAIGAVFLLDYFDDTMKSEADVEQILELPMLSLITKINKSDLKLRKTRTSDREVGEGQYVAAE